MTGNPDFDTTLADLRFYASHPHACSYLPDEEAVTLFVDPAQSMTMSIYCTLARLGFRRSGDYIYRPHCPTCHACIPVRVPVARFHPNRSQRRCARRNRDVTLSIRPASFEAREYALYRQYMQARHPGGGMDEDDPGIYHRLLGAAWSDTLLYVYRRGERLLAVSVVDRCEDGLSAVYTFFDPTESARSPGTFAILQLIDQARRQDRQYVYLGFWNPRSDKMVYKQRFQPLEYFDGHEWRNEPPNGTIPG